MTKFSKRHKTDAQVRREMEKRSEAGEPDTEYEDWREEERKYKKVLGTAITGKY